MDALTWAEHWELAVLAPAVVLRSTARSVALDQLSAASLALVISKEDVDGCSPAYPTLVHR